jgi:hypothetical protein
MNAMFDGQNGNVMIGFMPVLAIDMFEHSYFHDFFENKKEYLYKMMQEINWEVVENRIFTSGGVLTGVFGGDVIVTSYWGVAINLNNGGWANGIGGGNNSWSYEPGYSAFTVNMRSSTTQTTFVSFGH